MNLQLIQTFPSSLPHFMLLSSSLATNIFDINFCLIYVSEFCEKLFWRKSHQASESKEGQYNQTRQNKNSRGSRTKHQSGTLEMRYAAFPSFNQSQILDHEIKILILAGKYFTHLKSSFFINSTMMSFSG